MGPDLHPSLSLLHSDPDVEGTGVQGEIGLDDDGESSGADGEGGVTVTWGDQLVFLLRREGEVEWGEGRFILLPPHLLSASLVQAGVYSLGDSGVYFFGGSLHLLKDRFQLLVVPSLVVECLISGWFLQSLRSLPILVFLHLFQQLILLEYPTLLAFLWGG